MNSRFFGSQRLWEEIRNYFVFKEEEILDKESWLSSIRFELNTRVYGAYIPNVRLKKNSSSKGNFSSPFVGNNRFSFAILENYFLFLGFFRWKFQTNFLCDFKSFENFEFFFFGEFENFFFISSGFFSQEGEKQYPLLGEFIDLEGII